MSIPKKIKERLDWNYEDTKAIVIKIQTIRGIINEIIGEIDVTGIAIDTILDEYGLETIDDYIDLKFGLEE